MIQGAPCIIATGGGAPMRAENCQLMAPHFIIHITAEPRAVFNRIMRKGRPAFFPPNENPWSVFYRLWKTRESVYKHIATFSIKNRRSIQDTVEKIIETIE
jgi:shikimate kinase